MYQEKFNYTIPFNKEKVSSSEITYALGPHFLFEVWLNDYFFFNIVLEPDKNLTLSELSHVHNFR